MRTYTVIAVLGFNPGTVLGLSKEQAHRRRHLLKPLGEGLYEVTGRVEFKVGEEIATDVELNKALATALQPPGAALEAGAQPKPDHKAKKK